VGVSVQLVAHDGPDFGGIFAELGRRATASSRAPSPTGSGWRSHRHLVSGQRSPSHRALSDSQVRRRPGGADDRCQRARHQRPPAGLVAHGKAKAVRVYHYGDIRTALTDLTTGGCDAFMKLGPVLTELVGPVAGVEVVQRKLSRENIAIAVASDAEALLQRMATAQAELEDDGTLQGLRRKWLGNPYVDQSLAAH
jgi:hypothetical protein